MRSFVRAVQHPDPTQASVAIARLLESSADAASTEKLFALLYDELRRLAEAQLRRRGGSLPLGATTLVHELYLRMAGGDERAFPDRARFCAYASRAMRGLAIDFARRRSAKKRGSQIELTLDESGAVSLEAMAAAPSWKPSARRSASWPRWTRRSRSWWTCTSSEASHS